MCMEEAADRILVQTALKNKSRNKVEKALEKEEKLDMLGVGSGSSSMNAAIDKPYIEPEGSFNLTEESGIPGPSIGASSASYGSSGQPNHADMSSEFSPPLIRGVSSSFSSSTDPGRSFQQEQVVLGTGPSPRGCRAIHGRNCKTCGLM